MILQYSQIRKKTETIRPQSDIQLKMFDVNKV